MNKLTNKYTYVISQQKHYYADLHDRMISYGENPLYVAMYLQGYLTPRRFIQLNYITKRFIDRYGDLQ